MSDRYFERFRQSGRDYRVQSHDAVRFREQMMAALIGALALFLAFWVAWLDGQNGPSCARSSISHYFYEPLAGTFFVMALSFIGAFMMAYRGRNAAESIAATVGGVAALVVAFFPTDGLGCAAGHVVDIRPSVELMVPAVFDGGAKPSEFDLPAVTARIGDAVTQGWHFRGAAVLFSILFLFSLVLFPWNDPEYDTVPHPTDPNRRKTTAAKWTRRLLVYWPMSAVMAIGLFMIVRSESGLAIWLSGWMAEFVAASGQGSPDAATVARPVYHGEMLALMAFGVSWLVKGRIWLGGLDRLAFLRR